MSERLYFIRVKLPDGPVGEVLAEFDKKQYTSLRKAREITAAVTTLWPDVACQIISVGKSVRPEQKVLHANRRIAEWTQVQ